ncbi:hypothetical protein Poly24_43190 [Rosistilla carotiformis]|uniref:Plasmid stabilization system protein n=1 Tax=Rosistilla carotiformis TaxID=2528017 RepID=A0A518JYH9_9BACT|nr:hypothetical protein Poly24_43190 [Rosistilla carotiformis]
MQPWRRDRGSIGVPIGIESSAHVHAVQGPRWLYCFLATESHAGRAIEDNPERWESYLRGTHRYLMKRFPYVIVYRVATDRIEILAVAHGRQKPGFWKERLKTD